MEQCTVVRASLTAMRFRFRSLLQIRKSLNLVKLRKKKTERYQLETAKIKNMFLFREERERLQKILSTGCIFLTCFSL